MHYMNPHVAVRTIYLDDKSAPRHRETSRLLPRLPISGGRDCLFFVDGQVLSWRMYSPFWFYVKANPHVLEEAKNSTIVGFPAELRVLEMSLQAEIERPGEKAFLVKARDKCIKQMFLKLTEERGMDESIAFREMAARFREDSRTLYRVVRGRDTDVQKDMRYYRKVFKGDARIEVVYKALLRARVLAANKRLLGESFGLEDLLPHHPGSSAQYMPPVCPVLGFTLDYTPNGKNVQAVRVGRKDANLPYGPKNVVIMSRLAARMIEGSVSVNTASLAMDPDMGAHWREWTKTHSVMLGKTALGRPMGRPNNAYNPDAYKVKRRRAPAGAPEFREQEVPSTSQDADIRTDKDETWEELEARVAAHFDARKATQKT